MGIAAHTNPIQRAESIGVFRLWRDLDDDGLADTGEITAIETGSNVGRNSAQALNDKSVI